MGAVRTRRRRLSPKVEQRLGLGRIDGERPLPMDPCQRFISSPVRHYAQIIVRARVACARISTLGVVISTSLLRAQPVTTGLQFCAEFLPRE